MHMQLLNLHKLQISLARELRANMMCFAIEMTAAPGPKRAMLQDVAAYPVPAATAVTEVAHRVTNVRFW